MDLFQGGYQETSIWASRQTSDLTGTSVGFRLRFSLGSVEPGVIWFMGCMSFPLLCVYWSVQIIATYLRRERSPQMVVKSKGIPLQIPLIQVQEIW